MAITLTQGPSFRMNLNPQTGNPCKFVRLVVPQIFFHHQFWQFARPHFAAQDLRLLEELLSAWYQRILRTHKFQVVDCIFGLLASYLEDFWKLLACTEAGFFSEKCLFWKSLICCSSNQIRLLSSGLLFAFKDLFFCLREKKTYCFQGSYCPNFLIMLKFGC